MNYSNQTISSDVSSKYLFPEKMAEIITHNTGDLWSGQKVNRELVKLGLQYRNSNNQWERTQYCLSSKAFCTSNGSVLMWNSKLINIIIESVYRTNTSLNLQSIILEEQYNI
ncbi:hypothetical protein [Anabaena sp. AL09]|uniref:hypothetical protein n=1 Tax=Anabaena sp. AL09 TaxID=1710891 RepID=UPI0008012AA9|nr:hypothetical protein [Anabaena sp. AL09]OBQ06198.1 MAG: hypothetical protein AN490_12545 [Anabaena sp. AL09]